MSFSYVISLTFLILLLVSIILYTFFRKKNIVDEAPGAIAAVLLILLIFFSLSLVIVLPTAMLYLVSLGVNFLFGEYITYDSFFSLITFSLLVSIIVIFWSFIVLFIGKGITFLLKVPKWITYILEFFASWALIYFTIKYVLNLKIIEVSIWGNGVLILSFFVSFLYIGLDIISSALDQKNQNIEEEPPIH
ncbi:hypothetical protein NJE56_14885 [Bacillus pumilus]|uniref:hypothetical protein n=1 Tax=Bacillus pumilus TaxID=1408 RepID=UPI0007EEBBE4|nr:hypothetical protein [Bacillus pumilus]MBU8577045.1 hypothetical protein [Bacillus pumilus]MCY7574526.1 hypothetical protein [Bacillus pumilus]MDX5486246.1 hypothetical protein [Bacillus pumilus]OBS84011.1 hypothetical protein BAY68_14795 [Bacillus pumilus]PRS63411.1 hypothetical protein C6X98_14845 [Bacillus pumilus]